MKCASPRIPPSPVHLLGLKPSRTSRPPKSSQSILSSSLQGHQTFKPSRTSRPSISSQSTLSTSSTFALSSLGSRRNSKSKSRNLKLPELEMGSLDVRLSGIFNSNVLLHQGSMVQCIYVVEIYSVFCVFLQSGFLLGIPNRVAGMAT